MAPEGEDAGASGDPGEDAAPDVGGLGVGGSSYVPPHLRGRGGKGETMGGKFERDDLATLRVTNVSEFAEEQDLRDMFSRFGHVTRVFLAKDRETGRAKGFAFVSYADRSDASTACDKMDGCEFASRLANSSFTNILHRRFRSSYPARRVRKEGHLEEGLCTTPWASRVSLKSWRQRGIVEWAASCQRHTGPFIVHHDSLEAKMYTISESITVSRMRELNDFNN
jgi:RNA recognition motif-containing protein